MENDTNTESGTDSSSSLESSGSSSSLEDVKSTGKIVDAKPIVQKQPFMKRLLKHLNIYLLMFILLLVIALGIVGATWMASKNADKTAVKTQSLSGETLKQLANSDVTVGQPKQILSVQSNAVFAGKVLIRDSLEVAGPIQVGGALNIPGITVSGNSVFEQIQVNRDLNVAGNTVLAGQLSVRGNLTANGGTFSGNISAPQITTNTLQLNGNLSLTRHLAVGGATPSRSNGDALGSGGTVAVSGSDIGGSININTGSGPSAGCFTTVTFTQRYGSTPRVNVTPVGSAAGNIGYYVNRTTSNFSVCANQAPPSNTSFGFDYFIVE